jgi:alginate O-acetyltransferase complex protein AlgJ
VFLVTVFLVIISFPIMNDQLKLVKDIPSSENRKMAPKPVMDFTHLDTYMPKYEKYYNDNFSIRSLMMKYFNILNLRLFKKSPLPDKVVIGRNNWLFMANEELDVYKGINRFSDAELEAFRQEFEYRKAYLEARGGRYYFMVAPVKPSIYPEYMPSTIYQVNDQSWGEQLIGYLNQNSEFKPVDVYDILRENKGKELLYNKLDNHWTEVGAFYCAVELFNRLQEDFPGITIPSIEDYNITTTEINTGNIVSMISNIGKFTDYAYKMEPKSGFKAQKVKSAKYPVTEGFPYPWDFEHDLEIPGSDKPRILLITDSFGERIMPFIAEEFSRSVKIFDAWQYKLNEDIIDSEKPDVVLVITLESSLRSLLEYRSTPPETK